MIVIIKPSQKVAHKQKQKQSEQHTCTHMHKRALGRERERESPLQHITTKRTRIEQENDGTLETIHRSGGTDKRGRGDTGAEEGRQEVRERMPS